MARDVPSAAVEAGVDSIEHGLFLTEDDLGTLGGRGGQWVPTILRIEATIDQIGIGSSGGKLLSEGLDRIRKLLPLAVEAGVRVLAGTDLIGSPADVAVEALRMSDFGLSAEQVVAAVTSEGFAATQRDHRFEVGGPANAVFFTQSPIDDLAVLAHPTHVMRLGRLL
jgi:imidazolonepropionase-like amidohydrolase